MLSFVPRRTIKYLLEAHLVVALTLGAFILNLKIMDTMFPHGLPLNQFVSQSSLFQGSEDMRTRSSRIAMKLAGGAEGINTQKMVARIKNITNMVKRKQADEIDWNEASRGDGLFNRDAVQTFKRSSTSIEFDNDSFMNIGENSLVIIKSFGYDLMTQDKTARLVMSKGRLYAELLGRRSGSMGMEIISNNFTAKIASYNADNPAKFKIYNNPDKSSTIAVFDGMATIESQGEVAVVKANQALTITPGQSIPTPVSLIGVLQTISPKHNGMFSYHDVPREVNFFWKSESDADSYTIVIARDPKFTKIIVDEKIEKSYFSHANLKAGKYYWKVRGNIGWVEGIYTSARTINVVKDVEPPALDVNMPPHSVTGSTHQITGVTDPGTKIFVNNKPISVSSKGKFQTPVELKKGVNVIVVEAIDGTGNVNYSTKLVNVTRI